MRRDSVQEAGFGGNHRGQRGRYRAIAQAVSVVAGVWQGCLGGTLRVADQGSIPWRIHWRRWQFQPTFLTTGRGERAPRTVGPGRPAVGAESLLPTGQAGRRPRPEGPVARIAGETGSYPWRGLGRGGAGDAACLPAGRAVARAQQIRGEKCGLDQGHKASIEHDPVVVPQGGDTLCGRDRSAARRASGWGFRKPERRRHRAGCRHRPPCS